LDQGIDRYLGMDERVSLTCCVNGGSVSSHRLSPAATPGRRIGSRAHRLARAPCLPINVGIRYNRAPPISGAIANVNTCLRKLGRDEPNLDEVRAAVTRIGRDAQRAAEIIDRIRSQFEKVALNQPVVGVNKTIPETVALLRDEAMRYGVSVRTELSADLPRIVADRVQLQQVLCRRPMPPH
jgi:signal transduction histidine kinase